MTAPKRPSASMSGAIWRGEPMGFEVCTKAEADAYIDHLESTLTAIQEIAEDRVDMDPDPTGGTNDQPNGYARICTEIALARGGKP